MRVKLLFCFILLLCLSRILNATKDSNNELNFQQKQDVVAQVINGIFEENNLQNNNELINCFGDSLVPVYDFLDEGLKDPFDMLRDLDQALAKISRFMQFLAYCIPNTSEGLNLQNAYKIRPKVPLDDVKDEVLKYAFLHPFELDEYLDDSELEWNEQNFTKVGHIFAKMGHSIVDGSDLQVESQELIQKSKNNKNRMSKKLIKN